MLTDEHWTAFGCVQQEGLTAKRAADKMGVKLSDVVRLLGEIKKEEPSLFCVETEEDNMRKQFGSDDGMRPKLHRYDPSRDDEQVAVKF